jgi:hypothetical protein
VSLESNVCKVRERLYSTRRICAHEIPTLVPCPRDIADPDSGPTNKSLSATKIYMDPSSAQGRTGQLPAALFHMALPLWRGGLEVEPARRSPSHYTRTPTASSSSDFPPYPSSHGKASNRKLCIAECWWLGHHPRPDGPS